MPSTTTSRASTDTEEATPELQDRLARFARFVFVIEIPMFVAGRILTALGPGGLTLAEFTAPQRVLQEVSIVLLFVVWRRCRGAPMSRRVLEAIDPILTIVLCTSWAMFGYAAVGGYPAALSMILAVSHTLLIRSVLVPSSMRRTLWIGVVSTLPTIAIVARYGMTFVPDASPDRRRVFTVFTVLWCLVAVGIASVNSRALHGLRRRIREVGKLGQYTLEEKIGEGGMGVVHKATHALLRRPAAIKLLLEGRASEKDRARFEREVQQTSRLAHPNTISIFDYGRTADGVFYYVMEYLDGMDLERLVECNGPVEPARAIHILAQACGALAEAHALGLIHRDIKPANIVLTERADAPDVVKVVDFGLVKTLEAAPSESHLGNAIVGTPLYLAPEAITAPDTIDARADLYALGAVGYYLLTATHVFDAKTTREVCSKHLLQEPVPPSERLGKPVPADLEALVLSCLAKDRDARPSSAAELQRRLLACVDAARYDVDAARAWWRERGTEARSHVKVEKDPGVATTLAIDLHARGAPAGS